MQVSLTVWLLTILVIIVLLLVDFFALTRKAHDVRLPEAAGMSIFYVVVALVFGAWVAYDFGATFGTEYFAGYLVEKSLSIDNLFVFIIIFTQFAVPTILSPKNPHVRDYIRINI